MLPFNNQNHWTLEMKPCGSYACPDSKRIAGCWKMIDLRPRVWGVLCMEPVFLRLELWLGSIPRVAAITAERSLRRLPSLPDFISKQCLCMLLKEMSFTFPLHPCAILDGFRTGGRTPCHVAIFQGVLKLCWWMMLTLRCSHHTLETAVCL